MSLKLVSFVLCPFVQRAVITLHEKRVAFDLVYIDLADPPPWFRQISPFGKVPVLQVDGEVIFESAVILDYIDEVYAPRLHPREPLRRAQHKSWIEYGAGLLLDQHAVCVAVDEKSCREKIDSLQARLTRLAAPVDSGLFGTAEGFSLVDAAYAPFFMRQALQGEFLQALAPTYPPAVASWAERLLHRPSVAASVVEDFNSRYIDYFTAKGSWLLRRVRE